MMDNAEIKHEFPIHEDQCSVCLSVGRKLSGLGRYEELFAKLTQHLEYQMLSTSEVQLCWECFALLQRVSQFQRRAFRANELIRTQQNHIHGSQSTLATVVNKGLNSFTVYLDVPKVQTELLNSNSDGKEANSDCDDKTIDHFNHDICEGGKEEMNREGVGDTEKKKPKSNIWAMKRAMQNKTPKFRIVNDFGVKKCFNKVDNVNPESICSDRGTDDNSNKEAGYVICNICHIRKMRKSLLVRHMKTHYHKYICKLCDHICDKSERKSHLLKLHKKVFECVKCGLWFGSRREFFKHHKEWHEQYICDHCGISFKMRYCIEDHIRKQHSPYECKQCDKRFGRYNGLWLHNKTAHGAQSRAYCVECDKEYRDMYRYKWHLSNSARHTPKRSHRIPCPGCDKIFSKKIYMKDHYNLVHLKNYKYRCEQCDKNFIRNADLVRHTRRVHEGILPPKNKICYICGRGFSTNKILLNHVRTHTRERPYACTLCSARFAQRTALTAHQRAQHADT